MILDTSFLIHLFRGRDDAHRKGDELGSEGVIQRVPAPVVTELSYGVELYGSGDERRQFENAMRMYPVVDLDRGLARRAGELLAEADATAGGESGIDKIDPMIAAVADALDEPVLTENVADFETLGVEVETY